MMPHDQEASGDYLVAVLGLDLEQLLQPVTPEQPAGEALRGSPLYRSLQEARREDDPSLPQGPWERDLKRADWEKVAVLSAEALAHRSKDLQLAAWLAEAQVHRAGFLGLAAALRVMQGLCERYWKNVHPSAEDGDIEHRINIFRWVNEKLLPALRLVPITAAGRERGELAWADWEQAGRNEQRAAAQGGGADEEPEGATMAEFTSAQMGSPTSFLMATARAVGEARAALEHLEKLLDDLCGSEAPSMKSLDELLADIGLLVRGELRRRGAFEAVEVRSYAEAPDEMDAGSATPAQGRGVGHGAVQDRAGAYAGLHEIAEFLAQIEPHSPVPYLIKRAIEWGQLNTAELYELLFIRHQGQLSIFDLLGIEPRQE